MLQPRCRSSGNCPAMSWGSCLQLATLPTPLSSSRLTCPLSEIAAPHSRRVWTIARHPQSEKAPDFGEGPIHQRDSPSLVWLAGLSLACCSAFTVSVSDCTCWRSAATSAAVAGVALETVGAGDELAVGAVSCADPTVAGSTTSMINMVFFIYRLLIQKLGRKTPNEFAFCAR